MTVTEIPAVLVDSDGYPTEPAIETIRTWTGTPQELIEDVLVPIFDRYGLVEVRHRPKAQSGFDPVTVRLVTGGWSGNEEVITALKAGYFWFAWWESSKRGGSFSFQVPEQQWATPMPKWPRLPSVEDRTRARIRADLQPTLDQMRVTAASGDVVPARTLETAAAKIEAKIA